jgi:hypothetical protein
MAQRLAKQSATQAVLKKVEIGLRLFHSDWEVYPGQLSYPILTTGLESTNRLYYHIGTNISLTDRSSIMADADAAGQLYAYNSTQSSEGTQPSSLTYTFALINGEPRSNYNDTYRRAYAALINRMAREQVRLAAIAGNLWMKGQIVTSSSGGSITIDKSANSIFPTATSAANAGWATDYLSGDIERKYVDGETILDAWKRPLVYICQMIPGIAGSGARHWDHRVTVANTKRYGLGPIGFDPATGPGPALSATRPWLLCSGRITLSRDDAGDGKGVPADATYCPDTNDLLGSDIRFYAAPGMSQEFELWSCGRDQRFDYRRNAAVNADHLSATPYNKGL